MKYACFFFALIIVTACNQQSQAPAESGIYYTCSMDPQVVEYQPGICPICKMELTPVQKSQHTNPDELSLSDQQIELGNIQTTPVGQAGIDDRLTLTASLQADRSKINVISARVPGRLQQLFIKNTGDYLPKGAPLYDLYSEVLYNAQLEYLQLMEQKQVAGLIDYAKLLSGSKNKLLLWGMSESQIEQMVQQKKASAVTRFFSPYAGYVTQLAAREGAYVMEGAFVLELTDLSSLWVEAQVYSSQMAQLGSAARAFLEIPGQPEYDQEVQASFFYPELAQDSRINLLRATIANPRGQLRPGAAAYLVLHQRPQQLLTVPTQAVLRGEKASHLWVQKGPNLFQMKTVKTGLEDGKRIEILSGLEPGDVVVTSGAYLLHSEYTFKRGG